MLRECDTRENLVTHSTLWTTILSSCLSTILLFQRDVLHRFWSATRSSLRIWPTASRSYGLKASEVFKKLIFTPEFQPSKSRFDLRHRVPEAFIVNGLGIVFVPSAIWFFKLSHRRESLRLVFSCSSGRSWPLSREPR